EGREIATALARPLVEVVAGERHARLDRVTAEDVALADREVVDGVLGTRRDARDPSADPGQGDRDDDGAEQRGEIALHDAPPSPRAPPPARSASGKSR